MQIVEEAGLRIGVLGVIGDEEQRKIRNDDVQIKPVAAAIAEMLPALLKERCNKLILLSHSTLKEAEELAKRFPQFDFVVTTGGADEPPAQPKTIGKRTQLIEVGHKGMFCVVVGLFDDANQPRALSACAARCALWRVGRDETSARRLSGTAQGARV